MSTLDLTRLKALHNEPPRTLIALIRIAWPEIKAALSQGHSLKTVHQRLSEAQIRITYRRLSEYVSRLRKEEKVIGAARDRDHPNMHTKPDTRDGLNLMRTPGGPTAANAGEIDVSHPLADYRERAAKAKGFDFQPGPPDESKLI